jgi:hypothetical protein
VIGVAGVALCASLTLLAAAPDSGSFAVAVLRRDGLLIPFAAFDGKRWSNSWPAPGFDREVPISLASVPKGWWGPTPPVSEWLTWIAEPPVRHTDTLDPAGGDAHQFRTVHVIQPDWIDAHCSRQIALRTDYRSDLVVPPPTEQPYPKDGLAISLRQPLEHIEILPAAKAAALLPGLRERFNKAELETDREFGDPAPRRVREPIAPTVEALYAFGGRTRAYYVEASREYRNDKDRCVAIAFGTGWFVADGEREKWLDMVVDILRCDKYGATYMLPLGALRMNGQTFWMAQYSGWDHERYVVAEIKKDKIVGVVNAWGGGC